jgi:hypothetical protein
MRLHVPAGTCNRLVFLANSKSSEEGPASQIDNMIVLSVWLAGIAGRIAPRFMGRWAHATSTPIVEPDSSEPRFSARLVAKILMRSQPQDARGLR